MRRLHKQAGMLLIEVMVTIVIVSFGLLGVAGVILNGMKTADSSYARAQAAWLATDMIDRMRANRKTAEGAGAPYTIALGGTPGGTGIPTDDLNSWLAAVATSLPSGRGSISAIDPTTKKVTVTVQWDDSRACSNSCTTAQLTASQSSQFVVETRL